MLTVKNNPTTAGALEALIRDPARPTDLGGLVALVDGVERAFPLQRVRVRATVVGTMCRTVVEQTFHNPHPKPLEAVHLFPLPEDGVVVEAELVAGELTVRAECREREDAERSFAAARTAGHRAMLLTQERPDVHTLRVTNLPPGERVTVRLVVIEDLPVEDGKVRWRFPTTIAPRYLPGTPTGSTGPGVLPDTDHAPDASRLSPPLRLAGGTTLDLEVRITGRPSSVSAGQHAVTLHLADGIRVAPSGTATLNKDFVLAIGWESEATPALSAWTDGRHTLVHVVPPVTGAPSLPRDAVFVVDISGSMGGGKMEAARKALIGALHGLVEGDRFKLLAFDDRVEAFQSAFAPYSDAQVERAERWIRALQPRGGTEMLAPLVAALDGERVEGRVHTVLFITDGQAHNDHELMAAVAGRRRGASVFTLGIDTAVNGALLKGLARVGGGACTLCTPSDDIDAVVARIEGRFGSAVVRDVTVDGDAARPEPALLFAGMPARFALDGAPERVRVRGRTPTGDWSAEVVPTRIDAPLGAVWARERIAWLDDRRVLRPFEAEAIRPEIVRIALAHGVASAFTAFVAVERSRVVAGGEPVVVVQPVEGPEGWDLLRESAAVGGYGGAPGGAPVPPPPPAAAPLRRRAQAESFEALADGAAPKAAKLSREEAPRGGGPVQRTFDRISSGLGRAFGPPAAAPAPEPLTGSSPESQLAATQRADGSFGGDLSRTLAALVVLVLLGHTRRSGARKRTVIKAVAWLERHRGDPRVDRALVLLDDAESGRPLDRGWAELHGAGPEGTMLAGLA